jgi:hypothetical protein
MNPRIAVAASLAEHPPTLDQFGFAHAWVESSREAWLGWLRAVSEWRDLDRWPQGRLFGQLGEYRWQRHPGTNTFHAVLLVEQPPLLEGFTQEVELTRGEESTLVLWGDWIDPVKDSASNPQAGPLFYANEIPRVLAYPVDNWRSPPLETHTPRLIVRRYRDTLGLKGEFLRCVTIEMRGYNTPPKEEE